MRELDFSFLLSYSKVRNLTFDDIMNMVIA